MSGHDPARALYPFLFADTADDAAMADLLADARDSALRKCADVVALRRALLAEYADELADCARAMAERFAAGGRLIVFGNGGSATDAQDAAADCALPPFPGWRPLPALSLVDDGAVLTAIANDVGVGAIFTRQLTAFGRPGDIALGISTSGNSANVNAALGQAKRVGMLTIGFSGADGGAIADRDVVHHCFIARTAHIPRIQEGHATVWHALLELVQAYLGAPEAIA